MKPRVLLIGSGACAAQAREWDTEGWIVGAINNAWSIPKKLHTHIWAGDWIPTEGNRTPLDLYEQVMHVGPDEYDGELQRSRIGRQHYGIGATMLWNAAYWMLYAHQPQIMGFVGCSMNYPDGRAHTFYRGGNPDPLRFPVDTLQRWYRLFEEKAQEFGCSCINFGEEGLIPYERSTWPLPGRA